MESLFRNHWYIYIFLVPGVYLRKWGRRHGMLVNFALTSKIHGGIWEKKGGMVQLIDVGRWLAIGWGYVVYCDVKPG